jgi:hypothetical protein
MPVHHDGWVAASETYIAVVFGDDLRVYAARDGSAIVLP